MEKGLFVKDIQGNQEVQGYFLVGRCEEGKTRTDKLYWSLQLSDATGEISAKCWEPAGAKPQARQILKVRQSRSEVYREQLQLNLKTWELFKTPEELKQFDSLCGFDEGQVHEFVPQLFWGKDRKLNLILLVEFLHSAVNVRIDLVVVVVLDLLLN